MDNVILYLFGFAGTGKLTIAKEILKCSPFLLVDNHFINNVIFSLIDTDGNSPLPVGTWENVERVRSAVFDTIRDLSKPERSFVLTNVLIEGDEGDDNAFHRIRDLAVAREALFLPVRMLISKEELARRVVSPERRRLFKSWDLDEALMIANEYQVYIPKDVDYLELDVTDLSAADAAERILAHVSDKVRVRQES